MPALSSLLLGCFLSPATFAQSVRLNGRLADAPGQVFQQASTTDGRGVVYLAQQDSSVAELYHAPIGGGPGTRISAPLAPGEQVYRFVLASDARHVAYYVSGPNGQHLFGLSLADRIVVELDASADTDGRVLDDFGGELFSPDSTRVLYRAQVPTGETRLFSASLAGGPPVPVSGTAGTGIQQASFTPDSTRAVFAADLDFTNRYELYVAPLDGSQPPARLTPAPTRNGGDVGRFTLASDGRFVVAPSSLTSSRPELWSVPLAGGAPIVLDLPSSSSSTPMAAVTADGATVVFLDNPQFKQVLFRAPIDGSGATELLSGELSVGAFRLTDDGAHAVFVTNGVARLHSVPVVGGTPVPLLAPGVTLLGSEFALVPGGARVLYRASSAGSSSIDLYSVPVEGGNSLRLGQDLQGAPILSPDGRLAAFPEGPSGNLRVIGVRGGPAVDFPVHGFGATFTDDSRRLVVLDDLEVPFHQELFQFAVVGGRPTKLNGPLAPSITQAGKVRSYRPAGEDVLYLAQEAEYPGFQLFTAEADGSARTRLDPPAVGTSVMEPVLTTPDGTRVVFVRTTAEGADELYSALASGGDERRLSPELDPGLSILDVAIGPRGRTVAYRAARLGEFRYELYVVRTTGGANLRVNAPLPPDGDVQEFAFAGTTRMLYLADEEVDERVELYSVSLPGLVRVKLNHALTAGESVEELVTGVGGSQAVYVTRRGSESALHRVRTDGSVPAAVVTLPDGSTASPGFGRPGVTPDGVEFTFNSDGLPFVAAFAGGPTRAIADDVLVPGDMALALTLDPTGVRFCFQRFSPSETALYTVARAGGPSSRVQVAGTGSVFRFTPDGTQLVFVSTTDDFRSHLNVVSSLGGPSRVLADSFGLGPTSFFELDPDGLRVGYRAEDQQLHVVALDGLSAPKRVNEVDGVIAAFHLDRERVFYLAAPRAQASRVELFSRTYTSLP